MKVASKHTVLAALMLAIDCYPAAAQQPTQARRDAIRQSCRSDYQANCASIPAGGAASLQCLQNNLSELSPVCQSAVSAATQSSAPAQPTTATSQPPPTAQPTPAGSQTAPQAPPPMSPRQTAMRMRMACGADFRAYCPGVPFGGGRAMNCLAANDTLLSRPCRGALAEMGAGQ